MNVYLVYVGNEFDGERPLAIYANIEDAKARIQELRKERRASGLRGYDYEGFEEYEVL